MTLLGFHVAEKQSFIYVKSILATVGTSHGGGAPSPTVAKVGIRHFTPHIKTPPAIMVATDCGL